MTTLVYLYLVRSEGDNQLNREGDLHDQGLHCYIFNRHELLISLCIDCGELEKADIVLNDAALNIHGERLLRSRTLNLGSLGSLSILQLINRTLELSHVNEFLPSTDCYSDPGPPFLHARIMIPCALSHATIHLRDLHPSPSRRTDPCTPTIRKSEMKPRPNERQVSLQ